ncbi:MAG: hypothetical protein M0001_08335, partial [Treponema sp.]|nr:hypothetical protein [Treponema sp.]
MLCFFLNRSIISLIDVAPRWTHVPTTFDIVMMSFVVLITGESSSFAIGGHYFTILVGSVNKRINHGLFALLVSAGAFLSITLLSLAGLSLRIGLSPRIDIIQPYSSPTPTAAIFTFVLWLAVAIGLHKGVRAFAKNEASLTAALERAKMKSEALAAEMQTYLDQ